MTLMKKGMKSHESGDIGNDLVSFLNSSIKEKNQFIRASVFERKSRNSAFVVGGTESFEQAKGWGNFVLEFEIPREAILYDPGSTLYYGENEVFVPFFIQPEWSARIYDSRSGEVLYQFMNNSSPSK